MNINKLVKMIKDDLGLSRYYKTSFTDHDIAQIIFDHAVVEYSRYFKPKVEVGIVTLTHSLGNNVYLLPDWITKKVEDCDLRIEDIHKARWNSQVIDRSALGSVVADRMDRMDTNMAFAGMTEMRSYGASDIFINYVNTFTFEKPNRLKFVWNSRMNWSGSSKMLPVEMSIMTNCANNLCGVEVGREHTFYELAKLNVMIVIYQNEAKYIESINSGLGNINLKIEDWQSASERKAELLIKMYNDSILSQAKSKLI